MKMYFDENISIFNHNEIRNHEYKLRKGHYYSIQVQLR